MTIKFDALVIGTGQAGPSLAVRLGNAGFKTAIVERRLVGGTCVNDGCIPTKTLIASARAAHVARTSGTFGVVVESPVRVDMARVKARKDQVVEESRQGVTRWLEQTPNVSLIEGHARFEAPHAVRIGDDVLEADRIFINVGARAVVPSSMRGLADTPYLTSSTMMDVDFLPEHLVIVGGSYIGLEFAQMYRRFGSAVTVIEMGPRLIGREDDVISDAIQKILEDEGITVRLSATCLDVSRRGEGIAVQVSCDADPRESVGSHLLLAVGRRPNTDDLGLDRAGIHPDERGYIVVDDQLRTEVEGVWALGDVNGRGGFTHTSYNDYEIVAANLLDNDHRRVSDRIPAYALFIDPPLGRVGMTVREVRKSGRKALLGSMPMTRVGRARERSETAGLMQVVVDAESKKILGAGLLGIEADEAVHTILDVMYAAAPFTVITRAMHIHPTVSELIPTMLGDLRPLDEGLPSNGAAASLIEAQHDAPGEVATRIAVDRLREFIESALRALGLPASDARIVATLMAEADLQGSDGHGVIRLPQYARRIRAGGINLHPDIRVVHERPAMALVDGDNGMGHLVMSRAAELAVDKARGAGIGWVGSRKGNHAGPASLYARKALAHDMIGMYFAVGNANHLPPWGGLDMLLSTNPLAVAIPAGDETPVVLDMATTVAAYGKVKAKAQRGESMPEGWMIDREGKPLLDPRRAEEGFLVPIGGYKGYGLALIVGLLAGTLNGAAMGNEVVDFNHDDRSVTNTGQAIAAIDIASFGDVDVFKARVDALVRELRGSERMPGVERIWLPGEQSQLKRVQYAQEGIPLASPLLANLDRLAEELHIDKLR